MTPMTSNVLYWLRASLAAPPGAATASPERAATYRAALQQFEELLHAAEATGYAARPLPLFYALSQAGRAIVASRGGEQPSLHGLRVREDDVQSHDPFDWVISPADKPGWFQAVATATQSPGLPRAVSLGALMASLPELSRPILRGNEWRRALYVGPVPEPEPERISMDGSNWLQIALALDRNEANAPEDVRSLLLDYPAAVRGGYRLPPISGGGENIVWRPTAGGESLTVLLRDRTVMRRPLDALDEIVPQYRWVGRRWLRPALSGTEPPPSPLMTWWTLLFGLSMLARYHPAEWAAALDPEGSHAAAELERAMDLAVEAVPHLVLDAVAPQPVLLAPFLEVPPLTL